MFEKNLGRSKGYSSRLIVGPNLIIGEDHNKSEVHLKAREEIRPNKLHGVEQSIS